MLNLDTLTLGQAREISRLFLNHESALVSPWEIGAIYLIRTVTMIDTGRLVAVTHQELVLEDAAWIADTGRFSDALKACTFSEVETFPGWSRNHRSGVRD